MPAQILSTKISIPPLRSRLVPRLRLFQKLNQGIERGFLLISAPAGYGKSTLLSSWLSHLEYAASWLSLDETDNDLSRFLNYMGAALGKILPSFEQVPDQFISTKSLLDVEVFLTTLINHLAKIKKPIYLVLDDYHLIQNQDIHQAVNFLLEHRPPNLQLVIATRADPPLPLARMRVRSEMTEVRMADLRFTTGEAAEFLNRTMGLELSAEHVARLTARTEGWIAGLQMAALSMQYTDDISGFINTLTGGHHFIFDYLLEEILSRQSDEIRRFLLSTSILDLLTAPVCDSLVRGDGETPLSRPSSVILDELVHANLFIIPMDHAQHWYRYHPLFAELLRGFLAQSDPAKLPILHIRASAWFEEQGMFTDAIRHSFAAADWERVVRLISTNIFALLEQNELSSVARQLENLISNAKQARPWLLVGRAWLAAYTGQLNTVEPILKLAEGEFDGLSSEHELQTLGGHIATIRAYTNWIGDKRDLAESAARAALEWLPESEYLLRCQAATLLGLVLNDLNLKSRALKQALSYARECNLSHVTIFAHGCWAWLLYLQGRLHEARDACLDAIELASASSTHQVLPTLSHVFTTLSFVLCEWNDIETALHYSKEAVNLARRWEQADALHFALDSLGQALFASGDVEGAFNVLRQSWKVAHNTSNWFEEITVSVEVEWHLALGDLEAASHCLYAAKINIDEVSQLPLEAFKSLLLPCAFVQIYIAQQQYSKALALIGPLAEIMERRGIVYHFIRVLLWEALAYEGLHQEIQAMVSLKRALILAAPEGYLRTFIKSGRGLIALLKQARLANITPEYLDNILAAFESGGGKRPSVKEAPSGLVEPLSEREMDVLRLLAQGCSDKQIAGNLVIARETVHKHLKNIYGKLDVHSRSQAVALAHQLNLL